MRYYVVLYKWKGKTVTDVYGWEEEDFRNEDEVVAIALDLRLNRRNLKPPFTLKEQLALCESDPAKIEQEKREEENRIEREKSLIMENIFAQYCTAKGDKKSLKDEINYYKNWIGPAIGAKRLDQIALLDLERIRKGMVKAGKAPAPSTM